MVYFTAKKTFALLYAISPIDVYIKKHFKIDKHFPAISAHIFEKKGIVNVMELYPNMFEDIYHQNAYIYVCDIPETELKNTIFHEYTLNREVDYIEKIEIEDVYDELIKVQQQGIVKLIKYEELAPEETYFEYDYLKGALQNRAACCKTQEEKSFFEMVSKYFPK